MVARNNQTRVGAANGRMYVLTEFQIDTLFQYRHRQTDRERQKQR